MTRRAQDGRRSTDDTACSCPSGRRTCSSSFAGAAAGECRSSRAQPFNQDAGRAAHTGSFAFLRRVQYEGRGCGVR